MKSHITFLLALALTATTAVAADISGKWIAEITSPSGSKSERIFTFNVSGDKLTGTVVNQSVASATFEVTGKPALTGILKTQTGAPQEILNGKVSGEDVYFELTGMMMGTQVTNVYTGKLTANEIKFKIETKFPPGAAPAGPPGAKAPQPQEIVAKRAPK